MARATERAVRTAPAEPKRPRLQLIDPRVLRRQSARRRLYVAALISFAVGLFAVAMAQAELVKDQHELDLLRNELADLEQERDRLVREVDRASAPEVIVSRAEQMGMVRAADPVYLSGVRPLREPAPEAVAEAEE